MSTWLLIVALALFAAHLLSHALAHLHLRRSDRGGAIAGTPGIALLRPVCGRDAFDRETLESSFTQDWPAFEVVFCAPSADDPAVPLVRELMARHPGVRARLLTGQERITGNPKLDNLWKGWEATADAPLVCMADSNLLLPPDYLSTLVRAWGRGTGLVTSPACGTRPEGFAARIECAFLNGSQGRLQLASDQIGRGFAQGKTLFWKRDFLEGAGGLAPLGRWLAEDVAATRLVRGAGLSVRLAPRPFAQPIGRRSLRAVWDRQLRWSRVRRDGFARAFPFEILYGPAVPLALLALAAPWGWAGGAVLLWYGAEWLLCRGAGWPSGPADVAAMVARDLLLPAIYAATFAGRGITWRGTAMAPPTGEAP
ncbi:MAG: glycosyltransferase [Rubellimicrobium sp.]|nr:glycosyltransferase [Rubellimicrobium sp.]